MMNSKRSALTLEDIKARFPTAYTSWYEDPRNLAFLNETFYHTDCMMQAAKMVGFCTARIEDGHDFHTAKASWQGAGIGHKYRIRELEYDLMQRKD